VIFRDFYDFGCWSKVFLCINEGATVDDGVRLVDDDFSPFVLKV